MSQTTIEYVSFSSCYFLWPACAAQLRLASFHVRISRDTPYNPHLKFFSVVDTLNTRSNKHLTVF